MGRPPEEAEVREWRASFVGERDNAYHSGYEALWGKAVALCDSWLAQREALLLCDGENVRINGCTCYVEANGYAITVKGASSVAGSSADRGEK